MSGGDGLLGIFEPCDLPPLKLENGSVTITTSWGNFSRSPGWRRLLIIRGVATSDKGDPVKWDTLMDFDFVLKKAKEQ
jgi:hypothetical protein